MRRLTFIGYSAIAGWLAIALGLFFAAGFFGARHAIAQTVSSWTMAISVQDQITLDLAAYSQLKPCTTSLACTQTWRLCNSLAGKATSACVTIGRGGNGLALVVDQATAAGKTSTQVATLSVTMPQQ